MPGYQDSWTQTDASYERDTERLVRLWLLDAAIHQYHSTYFPSKPVKAWLPDSVFPYPGMSEKDMIQFMKSRGASPNCINYAISRFQEAKSGQLQPEGFEETQVSPRDTEQEKTRKKNSPRQANKTSERLLSSTKKIFEETTCNSNAIEGEAKVSEFAFKTPVRVKESEKDPKRSTARRSQETSNTVPATVNELGVKKETIGQVNVRRSSGMVLLSKEPDVKLYRKKSRTRRLIESYENDMHSGNDSKKEAWQERFCQENTKREGGEHFQRTKNTADASWDEKVYWKNIIRQEIESSKRRKSPIQAIGSQTVLKRSIRGKAADTSAMLQVLSKELTQKASKKRAMLQQDEEASERHSDSKIVLKELFLSQEPSQKSTVRQQKDESCKGILGSAYEKELESVDRTNISERKRESPVRLQVSPKETEGRACKKDTKEQSEGGFEKDSMTDIGEEKEVKENTEDCESEDSETSLISEKDDEDETAGTKTTSDSISFIPNPFKFFHGISERWHRKKVEN